MVFFNRKLFKVAILLTVSFLGNTAFLHAAAHDGNANILGNLTHTVEETRLGKKVVTYFYNGTKVGYIRYGATGTHENIGEISRIEIESNFRSKGLGSHFLQQALQDLKNDGYDEVRLEAIPFGAPIHQHAKALKRLILFYEKNGFSTFGLRKIGQPMHIKF